MFERFTDRARRVIVLAQAHARDLAHGYIGTEHLLLGLLQESEGVAGRALAAMGITTETAMAKIERGQTPDQNGHIPFTPRTKKVLELALREALQLGHNYIGTEHLLLAVLREGEGMAAQIIGQNVHQVRKQVLTILSDDVAATQKRSMHVVGIREPDEQWLKVKAVWDACAAAQIDPPAVVKEFFGSNGPNANGIETDLKAFAIDWSAATSVGVELVLDQLPKDITKVRFYLS